MEVATQHRLIVSVSLDQRDNAPHTLYTGVIINANFCTDCILRRLSNILRYRRVLIEYGLILFNLDQFVSKISLKNMIGSDCWQGQAGLR